MVEETSRVSMIWPSELKDAVHELTGKRGLTDYTITAVKKELGTYQEPEPEEPPEPPEPPEDLTRELKEARFFAQEAVDQLVLGAETPEERLELFMELDIPSWISTQGWPAHYAARVRHPERSEEELVEQVAALEPQSPRAKVLLDTALEEGFKPSLDPKRDDLYAKVMARAGHKLVDVPGLTVASELPAKPKCPNCGELLVDGECWTCG